jgi:tol-pal system-associated acyl-CoA thioesterase
MEDFYIEKKIYYHDTDCGGVVYYANYLKYLEEGLSEYCFAKGIELGRFAESGIYFTVAHVEIEYKSPARYQDSLKVYARVEKIGKTSISFFQKVTKNNVTVAQARTVWVCIGRDYKPQPVPVEVKKSLYVRGHKTAPFKGVPACRQAGMNN